MLKLDRTKDYGDVTPVYEGARYQQGKFHYDVNGDLVTSGPLYGPEIAAAAEQQIKLAAAQKAAQEAYDAAIASDPALQAAGVKLGLVNPADEAEAGGELSLEAWARGQQRARAAEVIAAAKERFAMTFTSIKQVAAHLVAEGLVPEDEINMRFPGAARAED